MLQAHLLRTEFELLNVTRFFILDAEQYGAGGEALTHYFAKLAEADEMGADYSEWYLPAGESRVWEAYSEYNNMVKRLHNEVNDNCGCSHGGWDYYRGLRGSHKALTYPNLDSLLFEQTDSYEHAYAKGQFCEQHHNQNPIYAEHISYMEQVNEMRFVALCVPGEVQTQIMCAQHELLEENLKQALYIVGNAAWLTLLTAGCLPSHL